MDGLEVVEIRSNNLERTLRIDSEFFQKRYLEIESILKSRYSFPITNLLNISDGNHMKISDDFVEKGVPYYRGQDMSSFFIEQSNPIHITKKAFELPVMKRSYLQKNDILLSIVGTIGKLSLVKENNNATCSCKLAILRPKIKNSNFISIFLISKYGNSQIERFTRGAVQKGLLLEDMNQLLIPDFSLNFQLIINKQIELSYQKLEENKKLYKEAEALLLKELDLFDFKPSNENIATKTLSESFGISGRLDSEYYQPKYDEIIEKIKSYKGSFKPLKYFAENYSTGYPFSSDSYVTDGVYLIRINNIKNGYLDIENATKIPYKDKDLSKKDIAKENDILISMSGTIGNSCKIPKGVEAVINQRIIRITLKNIGNEILPIIINSIIGQYQLERIGTGGVQTNISSSDILSILIPIIDQSIQSQIEEKIKNSFELKEASKNLLELAKKAVEVAIEHNEEKALRLLSQYL